MKIDDKFGVFNGKMFCVWEGNHMVSYWMRHINHFHPKYSNWHNMVPCISSDPSNYVGVLLIIMHDINKYIFNFTFLYLYIYVANIYNSYFGLLLGVGP
jgi:hypothetical protein